VPYATVAEVTSMRTMSALLSWVQSLGIGGAFFLLALATITVSGLALWGRSPP
jgi:hypothetical protein